MIKHSNGFLEEYYEKAKTGEIVIGEELRQELENLMEDMEDPRYIYDTSDANIRIDFIENCIRLTKSPFYGKHMKLMLFQKAYISALYGFKMAKSGLDRFKRSLFMLSRKNGKSELVSALSVAELILGNPGSDIVASSNDDTQASIVYDAIDTMRRMIDPKDQDSKRNQRFILNKVNNSKVFKLSQRTRNKDGRNIDTAVCDECHEMLNSDIVKAIEQSQSLKESPKLILITTEGFVTDGFLSDELKKARAVIAREDDGEAAERYLPWLYTQDSEMEVWNGNRSNRLWMKSNPTLGTVKKWEYMEEQVDLARKSKSDRVFVLSKDFNIRQNSAVSWLNLEDYSYPNAWELEDFRGCFALGAVDLSETTDLTAAKVLIMRPGDPRKYVLSHYFIPESKLEDSDDKHAGAKYKEWRTAGHLTITEGNDLDLAVVADWFYSLYKLYGIKLWRCGYDQRFAKDWIAKMSEYGWQKTGGDDSSLIMILQNAQTLNSAIKLCEADFKKQFIFYGENPIDKWCFENACMQADKHGQVLLVKNETPKRIDGAVCLAILYEMLRRYRGEYQTLTEKQRKK